MLGPVSTGPRRRTPGHAAATPAGEARQSAARATRAPVSKLAVPRVREAPRRSDTAADPTPAASLPASHVCRRSQGSLDRKTGVRAGSHARGH